jgi:hypothetical protein
MQEAVSIQPVETHSGRGQHDQRMARRGTHPMIDGLRPLFAQVLGVACCLIGIVSCATSVPLTPQRLDRVPAGRYQVTVSEDRTGMHKYNALLFETATATVTLALPTAEPGRLAGPEDYPEALQAGFVVYAVRGASGTVQAYLMVPAQARVMVWHQLGKEGGPVVGVIGLPSTPESAGSGGGGM